MAKSKKAVSLFLIFTIILSATVYYCIISKNILNTTVLMWCPAVSAFLVKGIYYRNEKKFFWNSSYKYNVLGILIPLFYLGVSYLIFWLSRPNSLELNSLNYSLGMYLIIAISSIISAMGEEIGWRGFLVPRLNEIFSFGKASIISGVIWSIWHYPLIISGHYLKGAPLIYTLIIFTTEITAMAVILSYLTLKSKGFSAAILFHASHNFFDQIIFGPITVDKLKVYMVSETGVITCIIAIIIAVICYFKAIKERL